MRFANPLPPLAPPDKLFPPTELKMLYHLLIVSRQGMKWSLANQARSAQEEARLTLVSLSSASRRPKVEGR